MRKSIAAWLLLLVLVEAPTVSDAQAQMSFRATGHGVSVDATRPDTRVVLTRLKQTVFVSITCPFGIDRALLRRSAESWPAQIRIRLHLLGLESFKVGNGAIDIRWSVSNSAGRRTTVSLHTGTGTTKLTKDSPYWTAVAVVGDNQKDDPAARYVEVALPAKLFDGNPREITLQWIDFFRR